MHAWSPFHHVSPSHLICVCVFASQGMYICNLHILCDLICDRGSNLIWLVAVSFSTTFLCVSPHA